MGRAVQCDSLPARQPSHCDDTPGFSAASEWAAFRKLMGRGLQLRAARQDAHGAYASPRRAVSDRLLDRHFAGEITLAFCLSDDRGRACALCIDLDERAQRKLPDIARALDRRGLIDASIATTGSDSGRAKVLVFFERRYAVSSLQHLARAIYAEAKTSGRWRIEHEASVVQFFPTRGEGTPLRIGGRNRKPGRNATNCDAFLSVWNEARSFDDVVPCKRLRPEGAWHQITPAPQGDWVEKLLAEGITFGAGSKRVLSVLFRLANEAIRLGFGEYAYRGWCDRLWASSPAMHGPSPSGDDRSERTWQRKCDAAWGGASRKQSDTFHNPESPLGANGMYQPEASGDAEIKECIIVRFVRDYARAKGFRADCVAVSIREMMDHLGCSLGTAQRKRKAAIEAGRIVVHDPGTQGAHGLKAIIGVVEAGETPAQVRERCYDRENMRSRRGSHERYAAKVAETNREGIEERNPPNDFADESGHEVVDETEETADAVFAYVNERIEPVEPIVEPSQERLL